MSAQGSRLVIRLERPAPDLTARLAARYFCAVPRTRRSRPRVSTPCPRPGPTTWRHTLRSEASCCAETRTTTGRGHTGWRRSATRSASRRRGRSRPSKPDERTTSCSTRRTSPGRAGRRRAAPDEALRSSQRGGSRGPPAALHAALPQRLLVRVQHPPRAVYRSPAAPGGELRHGPPGTRGAHGRRRGRATDGPVHPTRPPRLRRRRGLPAGRPGPRVGAPARRVAGAGTLSFTRAPCPAARVTARS